MLTVLVLALTTFTTPAKGFDINNSLFQGRQLADCASYLTCAD